MTKLIFFCASIFIFTSCNGAEKNQTEKLKVIMDGTVYLIPKKYVLSGFPESLVPKNSDMDKGLGVNLGVPYDELEFFDGSKKPQKDLMILMSPYSDITMKTEINPIAINAWLSKDRYKDRVIEFDKNVNAYRIYAKKDYPLSWQYFKTSPDSDARTSHLFDIWIASCSYYPWDSLMQDYSNLNCWKEIKYKTTFSRISFSGDRIKDVDKLLINYEGLLRKWSAD